MSLQEAEIQAAGLRQFIRDNPSIPQEAAANAFLANRSFVDSVTGRYLG